MCVLPASKQNKHFSGLSFVMRSGEITPPWKVPMFSYLVATPERTREQLASPTGKQQQKTVMYGR
uniref:Uncharacterized protein n=1 Tax=Megaselia scalaris TaxID=36166 RepID=T1GIR7_MEGSC